MVGGGIDPRQDEGHRGSPARPVRPLRWAVAGGLVVVALWTVLAALRPEVTYHLAPALVVWSPPFLVAGGARQRRDRLLATGGGLALAVVAAWLLDLAGWLDGPALVVADAFREALLVAGAAALVAALLTTTVTPR